MWESSRTSASVFNSGLALTRPASRNGRNRGRLEEEIETIKKYLELAETLYRVEADKAKLASLSSQIITDDKEARPLPVMDVTDHSRDTLLERRTDVWSTVPEAACQILWETRRAMHANELFQHNTPLTPVASSFKRDKRLRKVGTNTFEVLQEKLTEAV